MAQEDDSLTVALVHALDEVTRRVEEITTGEGLSLDQWLVLHRVVVAGDQAMRDLVAGTRLNDSTLTRVVDRLAALGLVFRAADPTDRRRVRVAISARGRTVHERLAPAVEVAERRLLDDPQATALLGVVARLSGDRTGA
ncbi:MarR family winged helix-turn-helix transcriptional regulator [Actinomycetospora callitridis]|uniref:MarR family winged helix-turn-helix transcriptional regulator n=1 Tax=Actinomycetospora callitridis TaxID=913944 RepID=UPI002366E13B|nr:MarR family transcriptional regulator [Actinomycetospora callitridis]MDD7917605.1 MarR family transcriptional regulator [Actinomycetospora callitridis]